MQFLNSLFGGSGGTAVTAILALGIVMVLIVLSVWVLKFVFKTSSNVARGRNRRLSVVDAMPVDAKRQLLIVRRDNVEHLILTGGPQDLVVEAGIAVEKPAATQRPAAADAAHAATPASADESGQPRMPAASRSAVERLREFTRPLGQRASSSLRHTGLMRPASRIEVIPAYLDDGARDSARTSPLVEAKGGDAGFSRNKLTADGK